MKKTIITFWVLDAITEETLIITTNKGVANWFIQNYPNGTILRTTFDIKY